MRCTQVGEGIGGAASVGVSGGRVNLKLVLAGLEKLAGQLELQVGVGSERFRSLTKAR